MKQIRSVLGLGLAAAAWCGALHAAELVGVVQELDAREGTIVVEGIEFHVVENTDFDMELGGYADLENGQRVEIDYDVSEGRHIINQIRPETSEL